MKSLLFTLLLMSSFAFSQTETIPEIKADLTYADRQAWYNFLDWPKHYEDVFLLTHGDVNSSSPAEMHFYTLDEVWQLIQIRTYLGAYQPGYIFMLYNTKEQEGILVGFPRVYEEYQTNALQIFSQPEVAALPTFYEDIGELELFFRWRGAGGCGSINRYSFESETVHLISTQTQSCELEDEEMRDMDDWPYLWPLDISPKK